LPIFMGATHRLQIHCKLKWWKWCL
jgi:hypothetical protein